ncbi:hypothetical protein [Pseudomonas oryzihabitans]|uniref:hypothetical protein n=1 Tax=Pseudomonas oryzihabitans TaxID=47885 RepID=UPI0015E27F8D|nr:hypothetical protein [Pseudomonas psychrotolerans]MBA1213402.1 hypothetical protein [Pseudomonas psychrotolerans]
MEKATWLRECREWCKKVKYLSEELEWSERPNHSTWLEATSAVLDENRITLPRLLFKGEYRPGRMGESLSYALMYRDQREMRRVFMLEVYPSHVRSHKEPGVELFGPHIHLGDPRLAQVTRSAISSLDRATAQRWVERFRRHAKIRDNGSKILSPPFENDLFG